jgi:hypothetical protein
MSGKKTRNEVVIGAVVIVILALVYFGVSFLKGVNIFSTQTRYYAVYDEIGGFRGCFRCITGVCLASPFLSNRYFANLSSWDDGFINRR